MIPYHARVAALDDDPEHLKMIVNGLGKAGFWAMPFLFDIGKFEPELPIPFKGIRLVFTDIHMGPGPFGSSAATYASTIIMGLKQIVSEGPYGLIFWSQFPQDADIIWNEIKARAPQSGLPIPVFYEAIDKNTVMNVGGGSGSPASNFDAEKLRDEILSKIQSADVLALAMSWDERVGHAAMLATNRVYNLAKSDGDLSKWTGLLAYLAQEAIGKEPATASPVAAVDNAMLPLLEDRLSELSNNSNFKGLGQTIKDALNNATNHLDLPDGISVADLNTHYLIEEVSPKTSSMWDHGMVSKLGGGYLNSGRFVGHFGVDVEELIKTEFILRESRKQAIASDIVRDASLHLVELSAVCDQVQGKVATHRYLLALLVPDSLLKACNSYDTKRKKYRNEYANASIVNIGEIKLNGQSDSHHFLVSTRRFMTLPPKCAVDVTCVFRLRRTVMEELSHHYATYARRPGVMRFS